MRVGPDTLTDRELARFESKFAPEPNTGCWLWFGATMPRLNYGVFQLRGQSLLAHRVALALKLGRWPTLFSLHSCDNPCCVNPDHLREGTQQDNIGDAVRRGRMRAPGGDAHWSRINPSRRAFGSRNGRFTKPETSPRGESHGRTPLSERDVLEIRRAARGGETNNALARRFGVSGVAIGKIVRRISWAHVPEEFGQCPR